MPSTTYDNDEISVNTQLPEYASYAGTLDTLARPPAYLSSSPNGGARRSCNSVQSSYYPPKALGTPYQHTLPSQVAEGRNGKKPWLTWSIADPRRSLGRAPKYPTFVGGEDIHGSVRVESDGSVKVSTISLHLVGTIVTTGQINRVAAVPAFLNFKHSIWPPSDPSGEIKCNSRSDFDIKFEFPFPTNMDISQNLSQKKVKKGMSTCSGRYATPPTYGGHEATIQYTLSLIVDHGRFHSNSVIKTPVVFIPCTTPLPPSKLRQKAYQEAVPPPLPNDDPSGWHSLPQVRVKGTIPTDDSKMPIEVIYSLSLASPKTYTRGSAIPCHLSIHTDTPSCLRQISMPQHQSVRLIRKIEVIENWHNELSSFIAQDSKRLYEDEIARCVFWMQKEGAASRETRNTAGWSGVELDGEIHLEKSLLPSFAFPVMSVEYSVKILPCAQSALHAQSFDTNSGGMKQVAQHLELPLSDLTVLASIPVSITTIRPPGPKQLLYARVRDKTVMEETREGDQQRTDRKKTQTMKYHGERYVALR